MNLHVMIFGKRTTISVDEEMVLLMSARGTTFEVWLGPDSSIKWVRKWIQKVIRKELQAPPAEGLSQWVQRRLMREIAGPDLVKVLEEREQAWTALKAQCERSNGLPQIPPSLQGS